MNKNDFDREDYYVYYEVCDCVYMTYHIKTSTLKKMLYNEFHDLKRTYGLLKPYEATEEGLIEYANIFKQWVCELHKKEIYNFAIDVIYWYTLNVFARRIFMRFSRGKFEDHESEDVIELSYKKDCFNSGLMYLDEKIKNKYTESYAYDYSNAYANCMASEKFKIPTKRGIEKKLKKIPKKKKIKVGYYRVIITCENEDFKKLFSFSSKNTYTHYSLFQALKYKKKYDVKFELNKDLEFNAYIYKKKILYQDNQFLEHGLM